MTRPASSYRDQKARKAATALPQLALGGDPRWRYSLRGCLFRFRGCDCQILCGSSHKASDRPLAMTRAIWEAHVLG